MSTDQEAFRLLHQFNELMARVEKGAVKPSEVRKGFQAIMQGDFSFTKVTPDPSLSLDEAMGGLRRHSDITEAHFPWGEGTLGTLGVKVHRFRKELRPEELATELASAGLELVSELPVIVKFFRMRPYPGYAIHTGALWTDDDGRIWRVYYGSTQTGSEGLYLEEDSDRWPSTWDFLVRRV